jgi:hypothetical protein
MRYPATPPATERGRVWDPIEFQLYSGSEHTGRPSATVQARRGSAPTQSLLESQIGAHIGRNTPPQSSPGAHDASEVQFSRAGKVPVPLGRQTRVLRSQYWVVGQSEFSEHWWQSPVSGSQTPPGHETPWQRSTQVPKIGKQ